MQKRGTAYGPPAASGTSKIALSHKQPGSLNRHSTEAGGLMCLWLLCLQARRECL